MATAVLDDLRSRVPVGVRHRIAMARMRYRVPTGRWRVLPDALVIGAQRGGTSALYRNLRAHPAVAPSFRKEVEYFSRYYSRGERWYRAHFELSRGRRRLNFEATPDYLFHPLAAERAAATVPDARLVVLLRNPVDRAWSHYQHMVRLGYESLGFADALDAEGERCGADFDQLMVEPGHNPKALLRFSYVARGHYAKQLSRWFAHYPRERFLILRSEDVFADPAKEYGRIFDFLELPRWHRPAVRPRRTPDVVDLDPAVASRLGETFRAPDDDLVTLLGSPAPLW